MDSFVVGIVAGALCTMSFVPQVIKIVQTKNTRDLSLLTFSVFAAGVALWCVYGLIIKEIPIVAANFVTLLLIMYILGMKIKYK